MSIHSMNSDLRQHADPHAFVIAGRELQPRWLVVPNPEPHRWELTRYAWDSIDAYQRSVRESEGRG